MVDNWQNRQSNMRCESCMHYCDYRCRRHAPTMQGFPAVYPSDWCGDHKMDKERMRQSRCEVDTASNVKGDQRELK